MNISAIVTHTLNIEILKLEGNTGSGYSNKDCLLNLVNLRNLKQLTIKNSFSLSATSLMDAISNGNPNITHISLTEFIIEPTICNMLAKFKSINSVCLETLREFRETDLISLMAQLHALKSLEIHMDYYNNYLRLTNAFMDAMCKFQPSVTLRSFSKLKSIKSLEFNQLYIESTAFESDLIYLANEFLSLTKLIIRVTNFF